MLAAPELNVRIGAKLGGLKKALRNAKGELRGFDAGVRRRFGGAMAASRGLAAGLAGVAAGLGLAGAKSVQMAGDMEQTRVAFKTLLGSAEAAGSYLRGLEDFAATTPFQFAGLAETSRLLMAMGFEAEQTMPLMRSLGEAVSAMGGGAEDMQGVARALGQMRAKGKVSAEELMQLAERGIPAYEILQEKLGLSAEQVANIGNEGVSAGAAIAALGEGMEERFGGSMAEQSRTLLGLFSTLRDNVAVVARAVGDFAIEGLGLKSALEGLVSVTSQFADLVRAKGLRGALAEVFPPGTKAVLAGIAGALGAALIPALYAAGSAFVAAAAPIAPFLAAGAAVGALAYTIYDKWDGIVAFFSRLWEGVKNATWGAKEVIVGYLTGLWPTVQTAFLKGTAKLMAPLRKFAEWLGADGIAGRIKGFQGALEGMVPRGALQTAESRISAGLSAMGKEMEAGMDFAGRVGRKALSAALLANPTALGAKMASFVSGVKNKVSGAFGGGGADWGALFGGEGGAAAGGGAAGAAAVALPKMLEMPVEEARTQMLDMVPTAVFKKQLDEATGMLSAAQVRMADAARRIGETVTAGFAQAASGMLEGIGRMAAGEATLGDVGRGLLSTLGGIAVKAGKIILATGLGLESLKAAFSNPFTAGPAAIAAGAALIAAGAGLRALASGGRSSASGYGASSGSGSYGRGSRSGEGRRFGGYRRREGPPSGMQSAFEGMAAMQRETNQQLAQNQQQTNARLASIERATRESRATSDAESRNLVRRAARKTRRVDPETL